MGPVEATARALGESLYDSENGRPIGQLVVVCGRNKRLVKKLQELNWKIPVHVCLNLHISPMLSLLIFLESFDFCCIGI